MTQINVNGHLVPAYIEKKYAETKVFHRVVIFAPVSDAAQSFIKLELTPESIRELVNLLNAPERRK